VRKTLKHMPVFYGISIFRPLICFSFIVALMMNIILGINLIFTTSLWATPTYPNFDNKGYDAPLNPFDQWEDHWYECTRYAFGRTYEKTGILLEFSQPYDRHGGRWYDLVTNLYRGSKPQPNSLAVWDYGEYGHVSFVEEVNGDNITISEANWANPLNGLFNEFTTLTTSQMANRGGYTLVGYIYLSFSDGFDMPIKGEGWHNDQDFENFLGTYNGIAYDGYHPGEDWNWKIESQDVGQPIYAVSNGKVTHVKDDGNLGYVIIIEHLTEDGYFFSVYYHVTPENGILLDTNVYRGMKIATIRDVTDVPAHLHFEIRNKRPETDLYPNDNGKGYYSTIEKLREDGFFGDPSNFIDQHRPSSGSLWDVQDTSAWYYSFVHCLNNLGIVSGYPDGSYRPNDPVNRVEFIKMVVIALELALDHDLPDSSILPDSWNVESDAWFYPFLVKAYTYINTNNFPSERIAFWGENESPDWSMGVTREEASHIVMNALKLSPYFGVASGNLLFNDVSILFSYYRWIYSVKKENIIDGYPDRSFRPGNVVNRAEASKFIWNLLEHLAYFEIHPEQCN